MIETSLDFSGLNDIAKDLEALSRAENNKVLRDATRAGAEVLGGSDRPRTSAHRETEKRGGGYPKAAAEGRFLPASIFVG